MHAIAPVPFRRFRRFGLVLLATGTLTVSGRARAEEAGSDETVTPPANESAPAAEATAVTTPAEAPPASEAPASALPEWMSGFQVGVLADAYFSYNFGNDRPSTGRNFLRAYDSTNGFALAWAGVNASYNYEWIGATLDLRFGPQAPLYATAAEDPALINVKQAYASVKPADGFQLDFGKFDQMLGGEGTDSYLNYNYSRGFLYWLGQPFFFTGLRAQYTSGAFSAVAVAVNGYNSSRDNNTGKTVGLQVGYQLLDSLIAKVGYVTGPEGADTIVNDDGSITEDPRANKRFRHIVDFLVNFNPTPNFGLVLNADYATDEIADGVHVSWYGVMLAGRYAFTDVFAASLRGEYYADPDGFTTGTGADITLLAGTLTLEAMLTQHVIVKLEGRVDSANEPIFPNGNDDTRKAQPTIALGVVAKSF